MGFDSVFKNRINLPIARPLLGGGGEHTIVWSDDNSGLLARLEKLEQTNQQLLSRVQNLEYLAANHSVDLIPGDIDATTFFETASDGTLRAGVDVSVPAGGLFEIALFPEPTVRLSSQDAEIREDAPDTDYGSLSTISVNNENADQNRRALVEVSTDTYPGGYWNMPVIALLRLALYGAPNEQTVTLRAVTGSWSESDVTWNTQPSVEEDQVVDTAFIEDTDTYTWFDVLPFLHRKRRLADEGGETDLRGWRIEADESRAEGAVTWYSKEGATSDDQKPQLLYWFAPETTKIAQGGTKRNRLYGKPGGVYWLSYRMLDANNHPSAWSIPVQVILPSQGDAPSAPSISASRMSVSYIIQIVITYTPPADFNHYEIEVRDTDYGLIDTIITHNDRMVYESPQPAWLNRFRVRAVTRSGRTSDWSGYSSVASTSDNRLKSAVSTSYVLTSSSPGAEFGVQAGTRPKANVLNDGSYDMLIKKAKEIPAYCLDDLYGNGKSESGEWSTANTDYTYLTQVAYKPPGSGTARILFLALIGAAGDGGRFALYVGSNTLISEYGHDGGSYGTIPLFYVASVSAGTNHNFLIYFRTVNATVTVYRRVLLVIDLGRI